ncbi:acetyl-CoA hydrolase/transferase C-terminal domain-containing protein [Chondromyces apiculatus]|uniref:Propionyl-CoA:succinyl-CoA transferase n=1 Tax=Chondromyces apiculatus DSM 436 TaxID=1192034 RepID=A0A017T0G7_9BACT|nr:acetyl-CoA hydrolase/transferase C-terminal domain-containing protein [Chondromyces apiculatus]EYF02713.1 Propionyl-CoA:succinyl-CoA transferase [Chondromyces apiculatus DSM 436]
MSSLANRVESAELLSRAMPVEEAVRFVAPGNTLVTSGFTKAGEPKRFLPALAAHLAAEGRAADLTLLSGASLSEEVEGPLAPFLHRRGPYMSSRASRKLIHAGKMDYADVHLSQFARNLMVGLYGRVDVAVVEVSRVRPDGSVILTSSVGVSAEGLAKADRIILEVNTAAPDYTGFHDIALPPVPPHVGWPVPITNVADHVGTPYVPIDRAKVVAVVESNVPDYPVDFKDTTETERQIARHVVAYLARCREDLGWGKRIPPLQSGVGNIANAVIGELYDSPFERLRFFTEVFQDGMMRFMEDDAKFESASSTAISLSAAGQRDLARLFHRTRERLVLRPMWLSNSAELITRLFVIAMNTPIEVDIYGHANSTTLEGGRVVNGLGGSGDFLRNAYLSLLHTPSVRRLKDGRTVSTILPVVRHVDHTEHDIKCIVTEQGYARNTEIRSPHHRAADIIDSCAHPHFRPLLHDYLRSAAAPREARPDGVDPASGFWAEYDAACRSFPR